MLLDNPAYAALSADQAVFAEVRGRVRRYQPDIAPFAGMPQQPTEEDWDDAADLLGPEGLAGVFLNGAGLRSGWRTVTSFDVAQMTGEQASGGEFPDAVSLTAADVPEMLELVAQTQPGPFRARTIELGEYLGIRTDGVLVAMAGERMRFAGWTEISAVCTLPSHRGRGLASRLMSALIAGIQARDHHPFLHVLAGNAEAIRLYEALGFRVRRTATITVVGPP